MPETQPQTRALAILTVLGGDRDGVFTRSEQEHLATCIPGATLKISPDVGHDPQWEAPDDVASDVLAFLRSP